MSDGGESDAEQRFVALSEEVAGQGVPMMAAMLLVAAHMGISADSRSFARIFGVEHALVLRELVAMEAEMRLVTITRRDERSQRLHFTPTDQGEAFLAHAVARET